MQIFFYPSVQKKQSQYILDHSSLKELILHGLYGTNSSALLFALLGDYFDLNPEVVVMPTHNYIQISSNPDSIITIEPTAPNGYNVLHNAQYYSDVDSVWFSKRGLLAASADDAGEGITGYGPRLEINGLVDGVDDIEPQADCDNAKCQQEDPNSKYNVRYPWANSDDHWDWWFERVHGSWAFEVTADWGKDAAAVSPLTEPFFHYGRDIIHSFNHWVTGWVDWNIVLNEQGGPNWAKNWCTAPITITSEGEVIYNPTFYLFRHFSKFIRPGSKIIEVVTDENGSNKSTMDNSGHNISSEYFLEVTAAINPVGQVVIVIMNDENTDTDYSINLAGKSFTGSIEANAMQTIVVENDAAPESSSSESSSSDNGSSDGSVSSEESSPDSGSSEESSNDSSVESSGDKVALYFGKDYLKNTSMFSRLVQNNLEVSISEAGFYTVKIFDITGKQVGVVNPGLLYKGAQTLELGNLNLGDAMYLVRTEIVK